MNVNLSVPPMPGFNRLLDAIAYRYELKTAKKYPEKHRPPPSLSLK